MRNKRQILKPGDLLILFSGTLAMVTGYRGTLEYYVEYLDGSGTRHSIFRDTVHRYHNEYLAMRRRMEYTSCYVRPGFCRHLPAGCVGSRAGAGGIRCLVEAVSGGGGEAAAIGNMIS